MGRRFSFRDAARPDSRAEAAFTLARDLQFRAGMRLLIVDDERPILSAMRSYFETQGCVVDCATEREEAEVMIARIGYACVILDLKLTPQNDADGLDLVRHCRRCRPETRIIVLTAYGTPTVEAEARALGADAFVKKPQSLADLSRLVTRLIGVAA